MKGLTTLGLAKLGAISGSLDDSFAVQVETPGYVAATNWSYRLAPTVANLDKDALLLRQTERFSRLARESGRVI